MLRNPCVRFPANRPSPRRLYAVLTHCYEINGEKTLHDNNNSKGSSNNDHHNNDNNEKYLQSSGTGASLIKCRARKINCVPVCHNCGSQWRYVRCFVVKT